MTNFISTVIVLFGYNSGYFWPLLFLSNSICRYNCNRSKILFWLSFISIIAAQIMMQFFVLWSIKFLFTFQATICGFSFAYNVYKRFWNRDYLFFWIEPILASIFLLYFNYPIFIIQKLKIFFVVYLSLQAFVALWEFFGLKNYVRDSDIVFTLVPQSPLNEILDLAWMKFNGKDAKLTGDDTKNKKINTILSNGDFNGNYMNLWKNQRKN